MLTIATSASGSSTRSSAITPKENGAPKIVRKNRSSMYTATLVAVDAMNAVTAEGAKAYAFGSHRWSGKSASLRQNPTPRNPYATFTVRESHTSGSSTARSAMFSEPVIT